MLSVGWHRVNRFTNGRPKMVRPVLSAVVSMFCPVLFCPDCIVGVLWPNGWMDHKNSSGDEIANVNFLLPHRTSTDQRLRPLNRLPIFYYKYLC